MPACSGNHNAKLVTKNRSSKLFDTFYENVTNVTHLFFEENQQKYYKYYQIFFYLSDIVIESENAFFICMARYHARRGGTAFPTILYPSLISE